MCIARDPGTNLARIHWSFLLHQGIGDTLAQAHCQSTRHHRPMDERASNCWNAEQLQVVASHVARISGKHRNPIHGVVQMTQINFASSSLGAFHPGRLAASLVWEDHHLLAAHQRPSGGVAPAALRRVREHVEARLSEKICLRELSAIAGLSVCHFCRAFKQSVGIPPHRYLMTRRIAAATRLIPNSRSPRSRTLSAFPTKATSRVSSST